MCTVSFTPNPTSDSPFGFTLISNRDESPLRITSAPLESDGQIYPRDEEAGGTWVAASRNGRVGCLLNGAFVKHDRLPAYSRSRGRMILEMFEYEDVESFFREVDLDGVEPFTLIIVDTYGYNELTLWEFRWDYERKHVTECDAGVKKVWSSSTLYSPEIQKSRIEDFNIWTADTLSFHKSEEVLLHPTNGVSTVSITEVKSCNKGVQMTYHDLVIDKTSKSSITCIPVLP
ncbi:MAG TPA: hypothetical protein EYN19_06430 [Flavobacteriales bacterium]|nr:hypothetical protein [Flavobacteriales bacterium]